MRSIPFSLVLAMTAFGCGDDAGTSDADADTDVDADTDADSDSDTDTGSAEPSPLKDLVYINEIFLGPEEECGDPPEACTPTALVEIANDSSQEVTLARANLCTKPTYWTIAQSIVIPPDGIVTAHYEDGTNTETEFFGASRAEGDAEFLFYLFTAGGEVALYDTFNMFELPDATSHIVDYVRWGTGPGPDTREPEAISAGLWIEGQTVDAAGWDDTNSLARSSTDHTAAAWASAPSTIGAAN